MIYKLNLQMFADEGTAAVPEAAGAETATAAEDTESVQINAGDTLGDGQVVSPQVAAAMNKQMAKHPELQKVYGQAKRQGKAQAQAAPANPDGAPAAEKTAEERWNEAKKGEFAEFYGRDVQSAIQDRFRNQADATGHLNALEPMLKVLRERAGVQTNDDLIKHVMDDDSLYEDAASEAGMTTEAYKSFVKMQEENERLKAQEQQNIQQQMLNNHLRNLAMQAEEFKKSFPDFDLRRELQENEEFFKLTRPEIGISVEDAYFATHHKELAPQMMAYGMERAKQQMGQTIQAQRRRPAEGAMKAKGNTAADINVDPRNLTRKEREKVYDLIRKGKMKWGG